MYGGKYEKLCFNENEMREVWKDYMEKIMNEENDWDHNVEGPVDCVSREEVLQPLNKMKTGKVSVTSDVSLELIAASRRLGIQVMAEICQRVLDEFGMPVEYSVYSMVVPIFKGRVTLRTGAAIEL